jgi:hypothetical protein
MKHISQSRGGRAITRAGPKERGPSMDLNEELRSLAEFVKNLNVTDEVAGGAFQNSTVLISRGDNTIILVGDDADKYTETVSSIYKAISERRIVSKKSVSDLIGDFFLRVLRGGDHKKNPNLAKQTDTGMQELKSALFEKPKNWDVQLIVEGLAPSGLPITIGQVHFLYLDEAPLSKLKDRIGDVVKRLGMKDADAIMVQLSNNLDVLRGKSVGLLSVNAVDDEAAIQLAKRKLQATVDAINFFASREPMGGWVFLPGDTMPQTELVLAICEDDRVTPSSRRAGPIRQIPLNQLASRKGFARVSGLLAKEAPTDLEEKILASLQWAGRAQVEARREEAFLLYAIALESLLLGRNTKTEISHRLAVRCAHLGGGPALADKKRVVKEILSLYETRSNIVHSGNFVVREEQLALMREYAVLTLFVIIDAPPFRSMTEDRELEEWFDTQLLSGGISPT